MSEEEPKYGPGWSLSHYERQETRTQLHEFLEFFSEQHIHRYHVAYILRDIARKVEERDL